VKLISDFSELRLKQAEDTADGDIIISESPPDSRDNAHLNLTGLDIHYFEHLQNYNSNYQKADRCCKRLLVTGTNHGK